MAELEIANLKSEMATWSVDMASRQVIRSSNHDAFYGYRDNLPHQNIEHFMTHVHPDEREKFTDVFRDAIARNQSFDFTFHVIWKDGSIHKLRSLGQVMFSPGGVAESVVESTRLG